MYDNPRKTTVEQKLRSPSSNPPAGLSPKQVPMFVTVGFDDNAKSGLNGEEGGVAWALDLFRNRKNSDQSPTRVTFYVNTSSIALRVIESPTYVKRAWRAALEEGHEIGNHTHSHANGEKFSVAQWEGEMTTCLNWLGKPYSADERAEDPKPSNGIGLERHAVFGFRTPFLAYNNAALAAAVNVGLFYDCSIEEGFQPDQDGTNYLWPYTLHQGSPGHQVQIEMGLKQPISNHPELWEMPVYTLIVPPDDRCEAYGVPVGMRDKMKGYNDYFNEKDGKITGFDYNLWVLFKMTKAEFLATLKYSFDLRLAGNRAPFMFGGHTDLYTATYDEPVNTTGQERREALEEFIDYALAKPEVRIVPVKQILDWIRQPTPI